MQRSGGRAPRAVMLAAGQQPTAAAAGEAVETMPPPSPQASFGGVTLRGPDHRLAAGDLDDVDGDACSPKGAMQQRATSAIRSSLAPDSS